MDADLFISLVIAHIIGDFYLQTDLFCRQKATLKLKSPFLYLHALTVGLLSWLLVPTHRSKPFLGVGIQIFSTILSEMDLNM